jgi:hypothetical protein
MFGRYQVAGSGHGTDYTDKLFRGVPKALPVGTGELFEILGFFSVNVEDSGLRGCYTVQRVIWDTPTFRRRVVHLSTRVDRSF